MFKKLLVTDLTPGMYVEAIAVPKDARKLSQKGWLRTENAIQSLSKAGVEAVIIDTAKQMEVTQDDSPEPSESATSKMQKIKKRSFDDNLKRASKLYSEAKQLQAKAFEFIREGKKIDLAPVVDMTDSFIEVLFEDPDALMCVSQIRAKDEYLLEHSINVSLLLTLFAQYLELPKEEISAIALGGFLHDLGKVKISDEILNKPGRLTHDEFGEVRKHVEFGLEIIDDLGTVSDISRKVVAEHHERLDGSGYFQQLSGDEISKYGRMAAIVDVYDALTAERSYKNGLVATKAFKFLMDNMVTMFDPALVEKFIRCVGVFPVGTLVELKSHKLGIVIRANTRNPLRPTVRVFYNANHHHYIEVKDIDLDKVYIEDEITRSVKGDEYQIDLPKFFTECFLD